MRKSNETLDFLFLKTKQYTTSKEFKALLEFFKRFRHMSAYNTMLVRIQKPGCMFATTAIDWGRNYNRAVKPEGRPLIILRPFGPVAFIYDLADTVGEDIPTHILNPFEINDSVDFKSLDKIILNMKALGIDFVQEEQGSQSGGYIISLEKGLTIELRIKDKKYLVKKTHSLVVKSGLSNAALFALIAHELGHYFCNHLDDRKTLCGNQKEFEAECVSYIVCDRLGIDSNSESYLWQYLDKNNEIPQISMDAILKAVGKIEKMYRKVCAPLKEVLVL